MTPQTHREAIPVLLQISGFRRPVRQLLFRQRLLFGHALEEKNATLQAGTQGKNNL